MISVRKRLGGQEPRAGGGNVSGFFNDAKIGANEMKRLGILLFAVASALSVHAQGVIWSTHIRDGSGSISNVPQPSSLHIVFDYGWQGSGSSFQKYGDPATRIFSLSISTNDSGRTFFADATTEPG